MKEFNAKQRSTESIKKTFITAGQNPWKDCKDEFKAHLDKLSKLPLYFEVVPLSDKHGRVHIVLKNSDVDSKKSCLIAQPLRNNGGKCQHA